MTIFSSDGTHPLPPIVFTTPEHFVNHVSYHLERIKANCQIVGVGRGAQDVWQDHYQAMSFSKELKIALTLTATLNQAQLQSLCVDYYKLNIKSYVQLVKMTTSNSEENANSTLSSKEGIWSASRVMNIPLCTWITVVMLSSWVHHSSYKWERKM